MIKYYKFVHEFYLKDKRGLFNNFVLKFKFSQREFFGYSPNL